MTRNNPAEFLISKVLCVHGFRAMFSTIADVIERQLAHVEANSVRGAYNHAEYLAESAKLMQWWSDYLDGLE